MKSFIPVNIPLLNGNEKKYLNQCIETGWISSEGPFIKEFENKFAARVGRKHGIAVCNGTAALDAAIEALGIREGDEVIMPTFTIISCISHLIRIGAQPVLIDSDPLTWNMDINQIESKITEKTRLIMIVHIYGLSVDIDPILDIAKRYNLLVLEDAAQMIGQTYKGLPCGSFGDISTFSFYPNKHITSGEGGMIVTNNAQLAEECSSLRNLCFQSEKRFIHERLGWNLRMTNLQAAIGLAQLERLEEFIYIKRKMGSFYTNALKDLPFLQLPLKNTSYSENIYWVFGLVISDSISLSASDAMNQLSKQGIGTRPFFYPMHKQPILNRMGYFNNDYHPVSERLYNKGFYIPSGLGMNLDQLRSCSNAVSNIFKSYI